MQRNFSWFSSYITIDIFVKIVHLQLAQFHMDLKIVSSIFNINENIPILEVGK